MSSHRGQPVAVPANVRAGASADLRDRPVAVADGVGCPTATMAAIGGPRVDGPPSQGYGVCVGSAGVGVQALARPRRGRAGGLARGVGTVGLRGGRGPTPRGFLPLATKGDGGAMAAGQPGHVGGVVCTPTTASPVGGHGRHLGPHTAAGSGNVLRPEEPTAVLGEQQSASSEEEDEGPTDSSSSLASGSEDWDNDQEVTDRKAPRHGFPLRLGVLNVRGWPGGRRKWRPLCDDSASMSWAPQRHTHAGKDGSLPPHTRRWSWVPWTWRGRRC